MTLNFVEENFIIGQKNPDIKPTFTFYKKGFRIGGKATPDWREVTLSGVGALTLTNALANSLLSLKLFGGTEQNGTPTPDNPMDIVCNNGVVKVSKNLFDPNQQFAKGYIDDNGNLVDFEGLKTTVNYIPVLPNTDYTVSFTALKTVPSNFNISTWTSNGTIIDRPVRATITATGQKIYTFTTTATTAKIKVTIWSDPNVITNFQIEQGSTATPYMPYGQIYVDGTTETVEIDTTGDTATAENLFTVGDYQDVQSVIDGGVTRNVGIKVLNGTEEVTKTTSPSAPLGYYFGVVTNTPHIQSAVSGYCTNFTITINEARGLSDNTFALGSNARMWFSTSKFTEASDFQQWLADQYANGTPVIIVYPLATATIETVTGQPMNIQAGTNIVEITQASIDNLGLEVSYKATV